MTSVLYFDCPTISSNIVGFNANGDQYLRKSALILCEGSWKDNKGNIHRFSPNRIYKIAERTNSLYEEGKKVGIYKDHTISTDSKVGDYVGNFSVREITSNDLDLENHPKLEKLLGKIAIFADNQNIVLKDQEIIKKYQSGLINSISPGINQTTDTIAEISLTPRPAMPYATLFMEGELGAIDPNAAPLTWEQINTSYKDFEEKEEKLDEIHEKFKQLCKNIAKTQNVQNSQQLLVEAIQGLARQYSEELGLIQENPNPTLDARSQQDIHSPNNNTLERYKEAMVSLIQFAEVDDRRRRGLDPLATVGLGGLGAASLGAGAIGLESLRRRRLGGEALTANERLLGELKNRQETYRQAIEGGGEATRQQTSADVEKEIKRLRQEGGNRADIQANRRRLNELRTLERRTKRIGANVKIGKELPDKKIVDTIGDVLNDIKANEFVKGAVGRTWGGRALRGAGAVTALGTGLYLANRNRGY